MSAYSILSAYGAFWTPFSCFTLCCWVSQLCVTPWTGACQLPWPLLLFFKSQVWGCFHRHGSLAYRSLPAPGPLLSEQWSRWLTFTVYPSSLQYVLWPQGLQPLPHSSTDTGKSIQWIWTASLPVQALTSAHSPGALRGVGSVGASQELPAPVARRQDLKARECFHGWLWEPTGNKQFFESWSMF